MKNLGVLLLLLTIGLCACDTQGDADARSPSDSPASGKHSAATDDTGEPLTDVDWEGWKGVYDELQPATDEAVAELRARVAARNASAWTLHDALTGTEIAYTPEHVRASWDEVDLHLDPRDTLSEAAVTACLEDGCTEVQSGDDESSAEAVVERMAVDAFPLLGAQLHSDADLDQILEEGLEEGFETSLATVESPIGPWDCLVHGSTQSDVEAMVGTEVVMEEPDLEAGGFASWCVDQRGLVVLEAMSWGVLPQYDSWHAGVDPDATDLIPAEGGTRADVDPVGEYDHVLWVTWDGVYRDVRPATEADVAAVRSRVLARNATSWTAVWDEMGVTLSVSPEHTRADAGYAEWHFEPSGPPSESTYVMCMDGDGCVRIGADAETDGPHLTNDFLDGTTFLLQSLLGAQEAVEEVRLQRRMVFAAVDSPVGPLDCLVRGTQKRLDTLEGARVAGELPMQSTLAPLCVDQRGLVTIVGGSFSPAIFYSSWREGVADDYDTYPGPVRDYNEQRED